MDSNSIGVIQVKRNIIMSVITGITQTQFEESIPYDKRMDYSIKKKTFYGDGISKDLFSCHYFKDGLEIGYWLYIMGRGFILPERRQWHPDMFCHLEEFVPWKNAESALIAESQSP